MAGIVNLVSYDLHGVKESFANWISNISPTDTPFVSMTGKEAIQNKYFQWQTDSLGVVDANNAQQEGSDADNATIKPTSVQKNVTQILRKVVQVSDTADSLSSYGRGSELAYQMEKAGAEIKRDLEWAFLHNGAAADGTGATTASAIPGAVPAANATFTSIDGQAPGIGGVYGSAAPGTTAISQLNFVRKTAGYRGLVAQKGVESPDAIFDSKGGTVTSGVTVWKEVKGADATHVGVLTEDVIFGLTKDLYLAGANANIIMFHPRHATTFSSLMENGKSAATRVRMFDGADDTKVNTYVSTLVDPLGQEFKLIPNRFMPENSIYVFDPSDWTQMVLRAPQRTKLAKTGSFEKWMIEMEVGLRHRNPFASGIIDLVVGA